MLLLLEWFVSDGRDSWMKIPNCGDDFKALHYQNDCQVKRKSGRFGAPTLCVFCLWLILERYRKAAECGNREAMVLLALLYYYGYQSQDATVLSLTFLRNSVAC